MQSLFLQVVTLSLSLMLSNVFVYIYSCRIKRIGRMDGWMDRYIER